MLLNKPNLYLSAYINTISSILTWWLARASGASGAIGRESIARFTVAGK